MTIVASFWSWWTLHSLLLMHSLHSTVPGFTGQCGGWLFKKVLGGEGEGLGLEKKREILHRGLYWAWLEFQQWGLATQDSLTVWRWALRWEIQGTHKRNKTSWGWAAPWFRVSSGHQVMSPPLMGEETTLSGSELERLPSWLWGEQRN